MTKSILDLCRLLPDSEPEIRERAEGLNQVIHTIAPELMFRRPVGAIPDWDNIADAKAATDTMIAKGFYVNICCTDQWDANLTLYLDDVDYEQKIDVTVIASTEELARSAACVLAAEAMKEKR